MMQQIGIVFRKEVKDNLRDRRALYSALFFPLLGPILIVVMFTVIGRIQAEQEEKGSIDGIVPDHSSLFSDHLSVNYNGNGALFYNRHDYLTQYAILLNDEFRL